MDAARMAAGDPTGARTYILWGPYRFRQCMLWRVRVRLLVRFVYGINPDHMWDRVHARNRGETHIRGRSDRSDPRPC
jgi:hypothetical protein